MNYSQRVMAGGLSLEEWDAEDCGPAFEVGSLQFNGADPPKGGARTMHFTWLPRDMRYADYRERIENGDCDE